MGIVTFDTVGRGERLVLMSLLQRCILGVVAIETKSGSGLGQMKFVFSRWLSARLMGDVTRVAPHLQRGVEASFRRNIQPSLVTAAAEILLGIA